MAGRGSISYLARRALSLVAARSARRPEVPELDPETRPARLSEAGSGLSRRDFLRAAGVVGAVGVSGGALGAHVNRAAGQEGGHGGGMGHGAAGGHGGNGTVGDVDLSRFDPTKFLRDFDYGEVRREGGRTVREWEITAEEVEIEVAPGVIYPAWAYNGQVPGPTLRATEGDRLRVVFKNRGPDRARKHGSLPVHGRDSHPGGAPDPRGLGVHAPVLPLPSDALAEAGQQAPENEPAAMLDRGVMEREGSCRGYADVDSYSRLLTGMVPLREKWLGKSVEPNGGMEGDGFERDGGTLRCSRGAGRL